MSELSPFTPDDWKTPDDIAGLIAEINSRAEAQQGYRYYVQKSRRRYD